MSLYDDYRHDISFRELYPFGLPSDTWITKDGTKIELKDMTEEHIKNCMTLVGVDDLWYSTFQVELDRRKKLKPTSKRKVVVNRKKGNIKNGN